MTGGEFLSQWRAYQDYRSGFEEGLDPETHSIEWLDVQVLNKALTLFATGLSAVLGKVETFPTGLREFHFMLATGDLPDMVKNIHPAAMEFAKSQGCKRVKVSSREGWAKALAHLGYEVSQVELRKAL